MIAHRSHPLLLPCSTSRRGTLRRLAGLAGLLSLSLIACTVFAAGASARTRPCAFAHATIAGTSRAELRHAVVCLVNKQRTARHLPKLADNAHLDRSAQGWTNEMVSHRDFTHGADFAGRISAAGFNWSNAGENIAGGFETPAAVVRGWMGSTGHCQNILSPVFRMVGTGVSNGTTGAYSHGTWTQDFGLWMGQGAASGNYAPAEGCPYSS